MLGDLCYTGTRYDSVAYDGIIGSTIKMYLL